MDNGLFGVFLFSFGVGEIDKKSSVDFEFFSLLVCKGQGVNEV